MLKNCFLCVFKYNPDIKAIQRGYNVLYKINQGTQLKDYCEEYATYKKQQKLMQEDKEDELNDCKLKEEEDEEQDRIQKEQERIQKELQDKQLEHAKQLKDKLEKDKQTNDNNNESIVNSFLLGLTACVGLFLSLRIAESAIEKTNNVKQRGINEKEDLF